MNFPVEKEKPLPAGSLPAWVAKRETSSAFEQLLMVVIFLLIFIMAARTPLDTDMWWHLRAGEEMLRTGRVLLVDQFSFTRADAPWTNANWLADAGMAAMFRWQGYLGISAVVALLATLSMVLVYLQCQGPGWLKAVALLFGSVVASTVWSPRPQTVSLVLFALVAYVLYLYKWRGRDRLWLLPLVFLLWGNVHGGYPLGLILIGAMVAGEYLNQLLRSPGEMVLPGRKIWPLIIWGVVGSLAVLINPNGIKMWLLPFQTVNISTLQQYIPEWASPDFHNILEQSLLWLLLAAFSTMALSGRMVDGTDLVTLLGFAYLAMLARRNFGPFALVAVPILTRYAFMAFQNWQERPSEAAAPRGFLNWLRGSRQPDPRATNNFKKIINLTIVALLGLVAVLKLYGVTHPALVDHYLSEGYPVQAVNWLEENRPAKRVLNEYNWGGFLQWTLPGFPIFLDGRTDLFNDHIITDWILLVQAGPGWQAALDRYGVELVMLQPGQPLLQRLDSEGWELIYQDAQAIIYEHP